MLHVFRKYQKIIYVVVTVVIVISFSFFGTYSTLQNQSGSDPLIFTTVDGRPVHQLELEEMANFLATDADDALFFQGRWGPNFLNDGVLAKDFIRSGLAAPLIEAFKEDFKEPFAKRFSEEKKAKLYEHPQGKFLSTANVWAYFAPEMKKHYDLLVGSADPLDPEVLQARADLFLAQKQFGPAMLRQVLKYQMKQYPWLSADANLERGDLSIFGYHVVDDWYGRDFTRLAAQLVINSAALAEKKGYKVSKEEAWAEILNNARFSYNRLRGQSNFKVASPEAYLEEQLRLMRLDRTMATDIWRQVLLFRRLLNDVGGSVLVDAAIYRDFVDNAKLAAVGELYQLPKSLRFFEPSQVQKLEIYLQHLAKGKKDNLDLTTEFVSVDEAIKKAPELVQKRYSVKMAQVDQKTLLARISVKETWDWQLTHWDRLKKEFPDIGLPNTEGRDERFAFLEKLDNTLSSKINAYARQEILKEHADWLQEALKESPLEPRELLLTFAGPQQQLPGVTDPKVLIALLDKASKDGSTQQYSPDGKITYVIEVIDNTQPAEMLLFAEALDQGILDSMLQKELESHYVKIREQRKEEFTQTKGDWKPLSEVSKEVAADRFAYLFKGISGTPAEVASQKLVGYMQKMRDRMIAGKSSEGLYREVTAEENESLPIALKDQWQLLKTSYAVDHSSFLEGGLESQKVFSMQPGNWSAVTTPANGDSAFFHFKEIEKRTDLEAIGEKVLQAHALLSAEAQQEFFRTKIVEMKESEALKF